MHAEHNIEDLGGTLENTPFWKAIESRNCVGVVQLMDEKLTPLSRVWCILVGCGVHSGCMIAIVVHCRRSM